VYVATIRLHCSAPPPTSSSSPKGGAEPDPFRHPPCDLDLMQLLAAARRRHAAALAAAHATIEAGLRPAFAVCVVTRNGHADAVAAWLAYFGLAGGRGRCQAHVYRCGHLFARMNRTRALTSTRVFGDGARWRSVSTCAGRASVWMRVRVRVRANRRPRVLRGWQAAARRPRQGRRHPCRAQRRRPSSNPRRGSWKLPFRRRSARRAASKRPAASRVVGCKRAQQLQQQKLKQPRGR
jgi:hypothetical protein